MKKWKRSLPKKKKWQPQFYLKNGTLDPKGALEMKSLGDLKSFKNQNFSNYSQSEIQETYFQKSEKRGMG